MGVISSTPLLFAMHERCFYVLLAFTLSTSQVFTLSPSDMMNFF